MMNIELTGIDIGEPIKGSTIKSENGFDLSAGGEDIWTSKDQFHFAYLAHDNDFDLSARIEELGMGHPYIKSGIMARESLDADSEHLFFLVFPDNRPRNKNNGGYEFQSRDAKGSECSAVYPADFKVEPPLFPVNYPNTWLRLKRAGNSFHSYFSIDGKKWVLYCSYKLKLSVKLLIGLALTSHDNSKTVTAKFRDITFV